MGIANPWNMMCEKLVSREKEKGDYADYLRKRYSGVKYQPSTHGPWTTIPMKDEQSLV